MYTAIFSNGYSFSFIKNQIEDGVKFKLYKFKSTKSKQFYLIRIQLHPYNFYSIKFHLKSDRQCSAKYNRLTNLNEARPIIHTCISVVLELMKEDDKSSFGFVGAPIENKKTGYKENEYKTKRYNLYKRFMLTYFSDKMFMHIVNDEKSAYMLVRKTEIASKPTLIEEISNFFSDNYDYFD